MGVALPVREALKQSVFLSPTPASPDAAHTGWRLWLPNLVRFQLGWFAAVLGAAHGFPWLGPALIGFVVLFHLLGAARPKREVLLILSAMLIGALFETLLYRLGWVTYSGYTGFIAPLWMIALWGNFATTLNVCLRGLRDKAYLLALLGLVGGPAAYWGGVKLGALLWVEPMQVLIYLALGWGSLTPLLARLAQRLDGYGH